MLSSPSIVVLLSTLFLALQQQLLVQGYPLIAQVPEGTEKCFNFNIPEDDDAHMVFLALPMGEETDDLGEGKLEGWLVQEVYELTKAKKGGDLPTALLNRPPPEIKAQMDKFIEKQDSNEAHVKVVVSTDSNTPTSRVLPLKFFAPTVINQVRESHRKIMNAAEAVDDEAEEDDLSGYAVCFDNAHGNMDNLKIKMGGDEDGDDDEGMQIQIIMDIVFLNDEDEENSNEPNFVKEKHLSPLEESLDLSIKAANTVLREMKYMTDREERMRLTADSINQRVQYFSIISVVILLAVTYVQVTYLKRYFKKKKLM